MTKQNKGTKARKGENNAENHSAITLQNGKNFVKYASLVIYFLFFPIFWAYKKHPFFNRRKNKAIAKAERRTDKEHCNILVVQINKDFIVGTRTEMRQLNRRGKKIVKRLAKSHAFTFDYRLSTIYETNIMNEFKEFLKLKNWILYKTGCSCSGLPRYFRNDNFTEYKIILQAGYGKINRNGELILKTKDILTFKNKYNEIFKENI